MNPAKNEKPQVSIIVGVNEEESLDSVFNLLNSFEQQEGDVRFEIIAVAMQNKQREKIFRNRFPWVRLIQTEKLMSGASFRNIAVRYARGEILVFMEDHVVVYNDYLKNLLASFNKNYDIVGGAVENGSPEILASWVQYFCEYHKWLPILKENEVEDLPGSNFACRSTVLKKLGPFIEERFKLESFFLRKARQSGYRLLFDPEIKIKHFNDKRVVYFHKKRFQYGRLFAARRGFSLRKRIVYIILSPLIAIVEYMKIYTHVRYDPIYLKNFIRSTPMLLRTLFIWMIGESTGYLFGAKN